MPKVSDRLASVRVISTGPCATIRPSRSSSTSVKCGGISSTWWVTRISAGASTSAGQLAQPAHEVLATAEVEPGGGLVEQHQLGVGHQRAGDLHPLALPLGQRAVGAVGEVVGAERGQQLGRPAAWSNVS